MSNKDILKVGVVVGLIVVIISGLVSYVISRNDAQKVSLGSVSGMLIENYMPYVRSNGGINSALPIQTSSTMSAVGLTDTGTLTVGSGGTAVSHIAAPANCTVIANATTIAASSTKDVDCAISGLVSTDTVYAVATTTMSSTYLGLRITAAHASTTAGYATLTIQNLTGTTYTWDATGSTSIKAFGIQ